MKVQKHEKIFTWRQAMKKIQTTAYKKNNQTTISIDKPMCLETSIGRRARENIQTAENASKPLARGEHKILSKQKQVRKKNQILGNCVC